MSLLPSAMRDSDPIPTGLGKKIERSEEKKKEVDLGNGIYSVDGKLETRRPMPDLPVPDIVPDGLQMPFKVYLFTSNGKPLETRIEKNEEANQPTTLEQAWSFMHGLAEGWTPHKPGDPMPCAGDVEVVIRLREPATGEDEACLTDLAKYWQWEAYPDCHDREIIAWRPAC